MTRKRMKLSEAVRQAVRDFDGDQRSLCRLARVSESMLSHFVAGRKTLGLASLDRLVDALQLELRSRPRGRNIVKKTRAKSREGRP